MSARATEGKMVAGLRALVVVFVLGVLVAPVGVDAQQASKSYTIGFLSISPHERVAHLLRALEEGLRDLGYAEGRNVAFVHRFADGQPERLPALAENLVQLKPSIIVAYGATAARAAKRATADIPIVMMIHPDPVSSGLVASMAKPGGNVTGLARLSQELSVKRLEILKDAMPGLSRVAVVWYQGSRDGERSVHEIEKAAQPLGVQVQVFGIRGPGDLETAFAGMKHAHADAVITVPSTMLFDNHPVIAALAAKHRLPGIFPDSEFVEAGGLMAYGARLSDEFRRAAMYAAKILRGAKPADLPVEEPTKLEFVINLKTAKALGRVIPPSTLIRADRVLE
jgi:putative tryptophan/tyrosine transport system substrate-binding protein